MIKKLKNYISKVESGKNYKQSDEQLENYIPLLRTQNVRPIFVENVNTTFVDKASVAKLTNENDLLFVRVGVGVGDCCAITKNEAGLAFSDNILRVTCDENLSSQFLAIYLSSRIGKSLLGRNIKGSGRPVISRESIEDILIPVLPKNIESALVNRVVNANALYREKNRRAEELLSEMSDYLFAALRLKPVNFEERICCVITLNNIIDDGTFSAEYYHPERVAALHSVRSNKEISARKLLDVVSFHRDIVSSANNENYLGLAGVESQTGELSGVKENASGQAYIYKKGDILYGRLRPYLNKVIVAEDSGICSTEFHVMRVIDTSTLLPEYVAAVLRSDLILSQTKHMMAGNTHPRISNKDVQNLYIPIPDITVQQEIVCVLRKHRMKARQLKIEAEQEWQAAKEQFAKELLGE